MQSRLLGVAQELESALEHGDQDGATPSSPAAQPAPRRDDPGTVDPHYEDLWVSSETASLNIADIPAMDIDFDDDATDEPRPGSS